MNTSVTPNGLDLVPEDELTKVSPADFILEGGDDGID